MWPSRGDDDGSVDLDQDWYRKYQAEQKRVHRQRLVSTAGYGFLFGQLIGTSAYVIQTRTVGPQALGAGAFMGVCLSVGFLLRSGEV